MLRFARNRPTQATAVDDVTVELAVLADGHVGRASTNSTSPRRCAPAPTARRPPPGPRQRRGPGTFPGFEAARPARAHHGHDPETAALDAALGGEALATAFAAAERHALEAHGVWTVAEDERGVATSAGGGALDRTTDAYMKVICIAPSGRSRLRVGHGGRGRPRSTRRRSPSAPPPRRPPPESRWSCRRASTRW